MADRAAECRVRARLLPLDGLQQDIGDAVALGVLKTPLTASQLASDLETGYAASASSSG